VLIYKGELTVQPGALLLDQYVLQMLRCCQLLLPFQVLLAIWKCLHNC
jgi:hypothetical protein